jgi:hypothetical protein
LQRRGGALVGHAAAGMGAWRRMASAAAPRAHAAPLSPTPAHPQAVDAVRPFTSHAHPAVAAAAARLLAHWRAAVGGHAHVLTNPVYVSDPVGDLEADIAAGRVPLPVLPPHRQQALAAAAARAASAAAGGGATPAGGGARGGGAGALAPSTAPAALGGGGAAAAAAAMTPQQLAFLGTPGGLLGAAGAGAALPDGVAPVQIDGA